MIDDGRSFEHSVKLQGGRFVEFTLASGFSLNPFSMVDDARAESDEDYRLDCFAMIKAIVGQMARPSTAPSDTERGLIDRAGNMRRQGSKHFQNGAPEFDSYARKPLFLLDHTFKNATTTAPTALAPLVFLFLRHEAPRSVPC